MDYKIESDVPISGITLKKIRDCLKTQSPHLFLKEFVDEFADFDGKTIKLGEQPRRFVEVLRLE